jgi:hypothetical protein
MAYNIPLKEIHYSISYSFEPFIIIILLLTLNLTDRWRNIELFRKHNRGNKSVTDTNNLA